MKTFWLKRMIDDSGVSGTGIVAEGVQFQNGQCVLHWLTKTSSVGIYTNIDELEKIHSHGGHTIIIWEIHS